MTCVDWTAVAPGWDRHRAGIELMKTELTASLRRGLGDLRGARVLELGAGTGELAALLADDVGPGGSLVATDVAEGMVELVRARLAGVAQAEAAVVDAARIPYPDSSFDAVVFRMGLMLLPEPEPALQEMRRVLRPGGRLAVAVWGSPQDNPWLTALGMAAMMHGLVQGGPPIGPGGPFSLADPDDLEKRVRNAGFGDVTVTLVSSTRHFASIDEHFDMVRTLAPPLAAALAAAPADRAADVRRTFDGLVAQYLDDDGLHVPVRAVSCLARV
jgi:SAM-dependent methyltransferase